MLRYLYNQTNIYLAKLNNKTIGFTSYLIKLV